MFTGKTKIIISVLCLLTASFVFSPSVDAKTAKKQLIKNSVSQVLTPDGYKKVSDLKVGDEVTAYDLKTSQKIINVIERIDVTESDDYSYWEQDKKGNNTKLVKSEFAFYLINGKYKVYKNQSIWVNKRAVHGFEINKGDTMYDDAGKSFVVTSIQKITSPKEWVEFIISGNHSYIIDGLLVHNASRYWVGGGSSVNWNATGNTNWGSASNTQDNASVPTSSDDVFFDGVGAGASNSTLSAAITIRSLNMTGYTNTLTHNSSVTLSIGDATAGASSNALIFGSLTYTLGSATTSAISFISTSTTAQNVNGNNKTTGNVTFNGSGGSWILTGTFTTGSTAIVTLTQGTLNLNGQTVSTGRMSSSNSNIRTFDFGSLGTYTITGDFILPAVWDFATTTNLTFSNAALNTLTLSGTNIVFAGGGLTYGTVALTGSGTVTNITGANTFGTLTRTGTAAKTDILRLAANQTVTSSLNLNGNSTTNRLLVTSDTLGTARTITSNALTSSITNVDFTDITGAGSMSWDLSGSSSGDAGGNSGITFITAATQTWSGTSGGNWSANAWTSRVPLPQDNVVISSAFSASQTVTADMPRLGKSIDWTGSSGSPTFDISGTVTTIYGSLTLISGMTLTTGLTPTFEGRSSFTLTSAGKSFLSMNINMVGGTLTLQDDYTATENFIINNGTFNANNKNLTINTFDSSSGNTRTVTMGSGTWTINGTAGTPWRISTSGLTLNENTSTIVVSDTGSSAKTFAGGGETYYIITFSGDNIIVTGSNTFTTINVNNAALANGLKLTVGSTQTVTNFTTNGSSGNLAKLVSTSADSAATLSKSSGTVSVDYMSIKDSTATGGAAWYAGANSTNVSGNTGWIFTAPPTNISVGGTVYSDEGTTNIGANITVAVSVNGAAAATTADTNASGVYSLSSVTVVAGDVLTLYLDGETPKAVTVTVTGTSNLTGIDLYQNDLITRCDNSCSLTNANLNTANNNGDTDIDAIYTGTTTITTGSGISLYIPASHTFAPANPVSVGGSWTDVGTFTHGDSTVTFNATATGKTITSTGSSFYNLTFNGSGGGWTLQDETHSSNVLTVTDGTLNGGSVILQLDGTTGTPFVINGTFTQATGTVAFAGNNAGGNTTIPSRTYYKLQINGGGETYVLAGDITVTNILTLTNGTLNAGSNTITLSGGTGQPLNDTGSPQFFVPATSTVVYTGNLPGAGTTTIESVAYNNLTINNSSETFKLEGSTVVSDTLTITAGTLDVNTSDFGITAKSWTDTGSGTFTEGSGTVTFDVAGGTINANETFNNVTINHAGTTTLGAALDLADTLTITGGALDVSGSNFGITAKSWTDTGAGTFTEGGGTVTFDVTGGTINSNETFENVTINHAGTTTLGAALDLDDTLTITGGALDVSGSNFGITLKSWTDTGSGTFTEQSGTVTFDVASGTINSNEAFNSVTINHAGTSTLGAAMDVNGTLTITSGTLDVSGTNYGISVATNWSNSGTFTAQSGTVTLDGTDQSVTGTTTFYNLTKQEATNNSADQTLTFTHTTTYTISNTFNLDGLDANDELKLVSSSAGTKFTLSLTGAATANYLDVKDSQTSVSDATCTNCTNATGNDDAEASPHWVFNVTVSIGGTVYTDEGTTNIGANKTVAVSVNGAAAATTADTNGSGVYSLSSVTVVAGDVLTLYLDDETEDAVTVTVTAGSNMTSIHLFQNYLITRHDNSGSLTNANINTANNNGDTDIDAIYTGTTTITTASGKSLYIPASNTFAPANPVSVGGSWTDLGTFTPGTSTVTFTSTSTGKTITSTGSSFYDLTFNGSGGGWTPQDAATVSNNLVVTAGTLTLAGNAFTTTGTTSISGTINTATSATGTKTFTGAVTVASGGTMDMSSQNPVVAFGAGLTQSSTNLANLGSGSNTLVGDFAGTGAGSTGGITFGGALAVSSGTTTNSYTGGIVTVTGTLTLTGNWAQASGSTLYLGSTTPFAGAGTFSASTATNTVTYNASGNQTVKDPNAGTAHTYYDLNLGGSGVKTMTSITTITGSFAMSGSASTSGNVITSIGGVIDLIGTATMTNGANMTVTSNVTIGSGTTLDVSSSNYSLNIAGNWSNSGTFTARSGTVTLDGTDQAISGTTTFYNLTKQEATNNSADQTLTFTHTTTYTISNTFNLDGLDANDELKLISSSAGTKFTLSLTSAATANYLDVKDSQTSVSDATCTNCTNAGGNDDGEAAPHWIFGSPTYDQKHFRFYSDNGVPAGLNNANGLAAEDTNYNVGISTTFRLRIEVANTGTGPGNLTPRLEFKENSGSWTQITTSSNNVRLSASANFVDGAATTTRLTAVGTFAAGEGKDTGSDATLLSLTNAYYTEHEYALKLETGATGNAYTFRITNAGTALDTYTVTPAINAPDATPPVPSGFNPATTSTIKTATPNITYTLDEAGDCKASTTNASYSAMSGADCTGDGSTGGACVMPSLGSNGSKTIYFACQDVWGNQDTSLTTHSVTYTLTLSSGAAPTITIKGIGKIKGIGIFK